MNNNIDLRDNNFMDSNIDKEDNFNGVNKSRYLRIPDEDDTNKIALLGRALSSPIRIEILRLLNKKPMLASEIADALNLQVSSALVHLKILEEADLLLIEKSNKGRRNIQWYTYTAPKFILLLRDQVGTQKKKTPVIYNIKIGDFIDAEFGPSCGFASESRQLCENSPKSMFTPDKHSAQIIWNKHFGHITYAVPNDYIDSQLKSISFSMELCSETNGWNNTYPSDITFFINDVELCTWTCPGDFGDRYGVFTPPWWYSESTKYGLLTNVSVKSDGVYLNQMPVNKNIKLSDLNLNDGNKTTFKIAVKQDAVNCGGFNIFGERFGDYNQAIIFTALYER